MVFILRLTSPIPTCLGINFFFFFNWGIDALGFPDGSVVKNLPARAGDAGSIPGPGRSLEEEMAAHSSVLDGIIPKDRGAWQATVYGITKELDIT